MKAIAIEEFGGPEKLKSMDLPEPQAGPGEVRIRVAGAGVNPVDWKIRQGRMQGRIPHAFPLIPGWDAAGTVDQVGEGVDSVASGDRVYAYCRKPLIQAGAYAQWIVVETANVAERPRNLGAHEAGAVPLTALTAYQSLVDAAGLREGETVLVHAAAGGVGHFAVQIARSLGARVIGTAGPRNREFLLELGVELPVDYTAVDFREAVRGAGLVPDVVLDTVGGGTLARSVELLSPGGRAVSIADRAGVKELSGRGVRAHYVFVEPRGDQLVELARLIEAGEVRPHLQEVLPLADAARAHEISEGGHVRGKLVLAVE